MLKNQIRVLIQRVHLAGRKPECILLPQYMRDALRLECQGDPLYVRNSFPKDDIFYGLRVHVDKFADQLLIKVAPKEDAKELPLITPDDAKGSMARHQPTFAKQKYNVKFKGKDKNGQP